MHGLGVQAVGRLKSEECALCYQRDVCEREDARYCLVRYLIWEALERGKERKKK